jgi:hypothetical protein
MIAMQEHFSIIKLYACIIILIGLKLIIILLTKENKLIFLFSVRSTARFITEIEIEKQKSRI